MGMYERKIVEIYYIKPANSVQNFKYKKNTKIMPNNAEMNLMKGRKFWMNCK